MNPRTGPRSASRWRSCWIPSACGTRGQNPCPRPQQAPELADTRKNHPHLRRASAALVRRQRFYSDLCGLQPDRRPRCARPGIPDGADRSQFARLQEFDAAVQPGANFHRALARRRTDQSAMARDRRADVAADADSPSLGLLRCVFHRGAAELHRDRPCIIAANRIVAPRDLRHGRLLSLHQPRGRARAGRRHGQRRSPRWRRCRTRASAASSHRSSRTSASASTCRTATPPPARSPQAPRPAPPIRYSTSRCSTSMPAIRSTPAPTSRA